MFSYVIQSEEFRKVLAPLARQAPGEFAGLSTLGDELLSKIIAHPDSVRIVTPDSYFIELPDVDDRGYKVYDKNFTFKHLVVLEAQDMFYTPEEVTFLKSNAYKNSALIEVNDSTRLLPGQILFIGNELPILINEKAIVKSVVSNVNVLLSAPLQNNHAAEETIRVNPIRDMKFGRSLLDMEFMLNQKHKNHFYVAFGDSLSVDRVVMVVVMDPAEVQKEVPDAPVFGLIP